MSQTSELLSLVFNQNDLLPALCAASQEECDQAGFGIVGMNPQGIVTIYNTWEARLSGLRPSDVIGRHFFTEIAPCTNNFMVSLRFEEPELDETLDYVFSYKLRPTSIRLRLLKAHGFKHQFMLVERRP